MRQSGDLDRRHFLIRWCQAGFAALVRAGLRGAARMADDRASAGLSGEFHLHPHYREQTPLDAAVLKVKAGLDPFLIERDHDRIAAILADWSRVLLQAPPGLDAIENALATDFSGTSPQAVKATLVRTGHGLEVHRISFESESTCDAARFLSAFRSALSDFSRLLTADFQVTAIETLAGGIRTKIRYEIVGTGQGYHREQRVGDWDIDWVSSTAGKYRVGVWRMHQETRSRSAVPWFADISEAAFGANPSYSGQLLHGVDYWRTVLDGACGIDIYGHNGVSVGDIDGDGLDDLYVCQPAGLPNRLYRSRGDGTFEDVTEGSGVGILENTACALFIDVDNDGRQDLVVVRANGPLLFLNQGGGKFRLKPDAFQFATVPQGTFTGASAADYDQDGWLDIYFCLYVYYQGTDQYKYPVPYFDAENGPPNFLLRNNRDGTFRDVTGETGLSKNNTRYSFCCGWNDYNRDGWPDLYVINDFGRKNLYRNNGDGTFTDVAAEAGVEDTGAGMSVSCFDYDSDGFEDIYPANMWTAAGMRISMHPMFKPESTHRVRALFQKHAMGNSLFRNTGKGGFQDVTGSTGVGMGRWAWSSDAWDFDHDGFWDLYIINGMLSGPVREDLNSYFWRQVVANSPDVAKSSPAYEQGWGAINELIRADYTWSGFERNVLYANNRDGTFSDVSGAVGLDLLEDGRAFALADFDGDGRQEVCVKNRNAPQLRLLRNVMPDLAPSVAIRLRGRKSNPDAIGAAVTVRTDLGSQTRMLQAGSGFLSQHSKEMFFGLGAAKGPVTVTIRWPSGLVQHIHDVAANRRIWVEEGAEPTRIEQFVARPEATVVSPVAPQTGESMPARSETWLIAPVRAPEFSLPDLGGRTWKLSALRGKPVLLGFWTEQNRGGEDLAALERLHASGLQTLAISVDDSVSVQSSGARRVSLPILRGSNDVAAVYNILFRYLFDRHRDLSLPAAFLIDENGDIVKLYLGRIDPRHVEDDLRQLPRTTGERLTKALPFSGVTDTYEFGRNYLSYGAIYFQQGYFDQAEASFLAALRDDPASAEAHYGLGSAYLKLDKSAQARESFERAAKLHASYPDTTPNALNNLGLLATREGRTSDAMGYFEAALQLNPDHFVALQNLGNAYRQLRRWDEARGTLQRAVGIGPGDPEANYSLGMVFAQTGDTAGAFEYLQRALRLRAVYPEAMNNLGILYLRTKRRDEAVATFEECIRTAPAFDQAYLNLARVYSVEGRPEKARETLLELLRQHPDHAAPRKALEELR